MATRIINAGVSLTDTSLTTVYTCPANYKSIVKEIWLTNVDGSNAVDATLKWTDDSDSDAAYSLLSTKSIAADSYLRIEGGNIVLEAGDILKVQAGAANDLMVSAFIEEIYTP
jgi:hypothetical protein|tara:strand:+ start:1973 stop:2311 length:339 start_codon:yes stop_codon:yes gene_type:complete